MWTSFLWKEVPLCNCVCECMFIILAGCIVTAKKIVSCQRWCFFFVSSSSFFTNSKSCSRFVEAGGARMVPYGLK